MLELDNCLIEGAEMICSHEKTGRKSVKNRSISFRAFLRNSGDLKIFIFLARATFDRYDASWKS